MRPGVKPNPKKDTDARRKRPKVPPYPVYRIVKTKVKDKDSKGREYNRTVKTLELVKPK